MKIYGVQFDPIWEKKQDNFHYIRQTLEKEDVEKSSLIVLPESFATGFSLNTEITTKSEPGLTKSFIRDLAVNHRSWVVGGMVEKVNQQNFNRFICYSPNGENVIEYDKIHLITALGEDKAHAAGKKCKVCDVGAFTMCPTICYDLRFPELFRQGTRMGANLFVVIACWPEVRINHWTTLLQARAIENQAFVIGLNRTGKEPGNIYNGNSVIFGPKGEVIDQLGSKAGILKGQIEVDEAKNWRKQFPAQQDKREELFLPDKN